jgi:hypothetical protein
MRRLLAWLLIARNYATAAFNYFSWHGLVVALLLLLLRMCCTLSSLIVLAALRLWPSAVYWTLFLSLIDFCSNANAGLVFYNQANLELHIDICFEKSVSCLMSV